MTIEKNQKQIENKQIKDGFLKKNLIFLIPYSVLSIIVISICIFCYYMFTLINENYAQIEVSQKQNFDTNFESINSEFREIDNTLNYTNQRFEDIENEIFSIANNIDLINKNFVSVTENNNLDDFKNTNKQIIDSIKKINDELSTLKRNYADSMLEIKNNNLIESNEIENDQLTTKSNSKEDKKDNFKSQNRLNLLEQRILQGDDEFLIFKIIDELDDYELNDLKEEISFLKKHSYYEIKSIDFLKDEFKKASNLMFDKIPSSNDGIINNIFVWASRSLHLRPINVGNPETPQEKISTIETALKNHDLKLALSVFDGLPNEMQTVARPWYYQAQNRLNFDIAVARIIYYLKDK